MKTYCGWTEEAIQEAELHGDYIPTPVWVSYVNDDYDGSDELPEEMLDEQD